MPLIFGTATYVGNDKYYFPICIVNPIKTNKVKKNILMYVEQKFRDEPPFTTEDIDTIKHAINYGYEYDSEKYYKIVYYENLKRCFGDLIKMNKFKIVSVNNTGDDKKYSFLIQIIGNSEIKCVVFMNKETKQIMEIKF
jgi:hypothetical protein